MKPLLMLSLPNSGSTWLASCIAGNLRGGRYYDMEYFNPLRNEKHERSLARFFGCELASVYQNIASPGAQGIHDAIRTTWFRDDYTFTKEVFCPFMLPVFAEHFETFVLLRSAELTFPPTRLRIWSFYEHAWEALRAAGHATKSVTARDKAREAHAIMEAAIRLDALRLGIPAVDYSDLFGGHPLPAWLDRYADLQAVYRTVESTGKMPIKST